MTIETLPVSAAWAVRFFHRGGSPWAGIGGAPSRVEGNGGPVAALLLRDRGFLKTRLMGTPALMFDDLWCLDQF